MFAAKCLQGTEVVNKKADSITTMLLLKYEYYR